MIDWEGMLENKIRGLFTGSPNLGLRLQPHPIISF